MRKKLDENFKAKVALEALQGDEKIKRRGQVLT